MPGTKEGAMKAKETIKKKYGDDFYKIQGTKGGKKSRGGGFATMADKNPELHRKISSKGGANRWVNKEKAN